MSPSSDGDSGRPASPDERYDEFVKENERWNERIEEALTELEDATPKTESRAKRSPAAA